MEDAAVHNIRYWLVHIGGAYKLESLTIADEY
jgi:hypothetical protein